MEDALIKVAMQGGSAVAVVAIIMFVVVQYGLPLLKASQASNEAKLQALIDDHRVGQREALAAHKETLNIVVAQNDKTNAAILAQVGNKVDDLDSKVDRVAGALEGIRAELTRGNTQPYQRIDPPSSPGRPAKEG